MSERADFYIEKVRYNKDHTRIVWVSVRQDNSHKLSGSHNMLRKTILSMIHNGKQFMTIFRNEEGKFRKGQKVSIIQVKGEDFIRTNAEAAATDQLDDLPEY